MRLLDRSDALHLEAAEGWISLGNHTEAAAELQQIAPEHQGHPHVLYARWMVLKAAGKWDACLAIAQALTEAVPDYSRGWLALAQTHYGQKRYQDAYDLAVSKITRFPAFWPLYYDAACYACLTNRLEHASKFLQLAMALPGSDEVKLQALRDPDLERLWRSE
jgi:tetratricopeptide (TPR) repeat protein